MATYKQIFGKQVKFLSSDPTTEEEGQVWYNSTSGTFKSVVNSGAWSSGSPLTTGRNSSTSTGIQTASLLMGGKSAPGTPNYTSAVEQYNGTGWSNETGIPTNTIQGGGAGTTTSALYAGGFTAPPPPGATATYEYDGSSWTTSPGSLTNGRTNLGSGGTQTAALVFGGSECPVPIKKATEEYNGTSWTAVNDMGNSRYQMMGSNVGLQTASLAIGGYFPPGGSMTEVESYDGTNWTATTALPTGEGNSARYGIQTAAVAAGGSPSNTTSLQFDGTTWTATPSLATAREENSGSGTTTAGVIGGTAPISANTEEYNAGTTVVVAAAWASAPALNTARALGGSAIPSQNAGIIFGGSPYTTATEQYNGSAWTTVPGTLNTPRGYISGFGTETAAVCAGGYTTPAPGMDFVEEYNGSTWSEETNLPTTLITAGNCGTMTAGLLMGGATLLPFTSGLASTTSLYDGTNWTAGNTLPAARGQGMSGGTQTAAFYAGGYSPGYVATTIEYDGTNYSAGGDLAMGVAPAPTAESGFLGSIGTLTAGLAASGFPLTNSVNTYDGTSWFTAPAYTTSRNRGMSGGTQTAAIIAGGSAPTTATEEFTGDTSAANYKTITTS